MHVHGTLLHYMYISTFTTEHLTSVRLAQARPDYDDVKVIVLCYGLECRGP